MEKSTEETKLYDAEYINAVEALKQIFIGAMEDDLNTADAVSAIFEVVSAANKAMNSDCISKKAMKYTLDVLSEMCGVLGILNRDSGSEMPEEIENLLEDRKAARQNKDFAKSDEIRDILKQKGYIVKDTPSGQQLTKI